MSGDNAVEERQREEHCAQGIHRNSGDMESGMHTRGRGKK